MATFSGKKYLLIEKNTYGDIVNGNYRSEYAAKSYLATLHAFNHRYSLEVMFMPDKELSGLWIYSTFMYWLREKLRQGGSHIDKILFSSASDQWATPQAFFDELNEEFGFTLDPCADEYNHKCTRYFTKEIDGLKQSWEGEIVFCNPPYGRETGRWVAKASDEAQCENTKVVMLIPARTDTRWFHNYIYKKQGVEIRFIKGRLKFGDSKNSAPFPSMVVIFNGDGKHES